MPDGVRSRCEDPRPRNAAQSHAHRCGGLDRRGSACARVGRAGRARLGVPAGRLAAVHAGAALAGRRRDGDAATSAASSHEAGRGTGRAHSHAAVVRSPGCGSGADRLLAIGRRGRDVDPHPEGHAAGRRARRDADALDPARRARVEGEVQAQGEDELEVEGEGEVEGQVEPEDQAGSAARTRRDAHSGSDPDPDPDPDAYADADSHARAEPVPGARAGAARRGSADEPGAVAAEPGDACGRQSRDRPGDRPPGARSLASA
jgi:hypothetical protein